ncbi:hypothetical protein EPN29_04595 [bacterium]|nr:MAG: hypothetical protein EPN29_04595 [bacterium]
MRSNILERYPSSVVRVYVVWFDTLPADSRGLVDRKVLNDPRVANYYDPNRVVGSWFAKHTGGGGIVWDAYFLYGADASWSDEPGPLVSSGGTVIGSSGDLAAAFRKLV